MLTKAILTGGVLSVLAGSIVYFGTENVGASSVVIEDVERVQETDMMEAAETSPKIEQQEKRVEVKLKPTPKAKPQVKDETPKTKLLDQYLKAKKSNDMQIETEIEVEKTPEIETEIETAETASEDVTKTVKKKIVIKTNDGGEAVWMSDGSSIDIDALELGDLGLKGEEVKMVEEALKNARNGDVKLRVLRLDDEGEILQAPTLHRSISLPLKAVDYAAVLAEAKKLQVMDMRDEAVLEILDYAIDRGDIGDAADMVDELSKPEIRDTARARIGKGLASSGNMEAAFAVLDELEIDELTAPIRLEIIAALMATREERAAPPNLR